MVQTIIGQNTPRSAGEKACSSNSPTLEDPEDFESIELGIEGWMVFCRFIALAQYLEAKRRFSGRHLQQTIDLHREEHLQNLAYETKMASKSEEDRHKADTLKEKAIAINEMKHREKQARARKKISYVTKKSTHLGLVRLGIPRGFSITDTKGM